MGNVPQDPRNSQVRIVPPGSSRDPRMSKPVYMAIKFSGDAEDGMGWGVHLTVRGRTPQAALAEFEKGVEALRAQADALRQAVQQSAEAERSEP